MPGTECSMALSHLDFRSVSGPWPGYRAHSCRILAEDRPRSGIRHHVGVVDKKPDQREGVIRVWKVGGGSG